MRPKIAWVRPSRQELTLLEPIDEHGRPARGQGQAIRQLALRQRPSLLDVFKCLDFGRGQAGRLADGGRDSVARQPEPMQRNEEGLRLSPFSLAAVISGTGPPRGGPYSGSVAFSPWMRSVGRVGAAAVPGGLLSRPGE